MLLWSEITLSYNWRISIFRNIQNIKMQIIMRPSFGALRIFCFFATRHENIGVLRSELHAAKVKAAIDRRRTNFDSPDSSYCSTKDEMTSKNPFPSFGVETCGQTRSHCDCVRCTKHKMPLHTYKRNFQNRTAM